MKVNKLLLHIGVHKTGTTAIQTFLIENRGELQNQGFYLPEFLNDGENKPAIIRFAIMEGNEKRTRKYLKQVVNRAQDSKCHTVIISDEGYCKTGEYNLSLISLFLEYFEKIEVIMYCRRPDTQLESGYAFCVMWKESQIELSPEQWVRTHSPKHYYDVACFYDKFIPGSKIKLVSYDYNKNRLISSFVEVCGLAPSNYQLPKSKDANVSANKYMIEVMVELNKYSLSHELFEEIKETVLHHELLQNGPKAVFLDNKYREKIMCLLEGEHNRLFNQYNKGKNLFLPLSQIHVPIGIEPQLKKKIIKEIIHHFQLESDFISWPYKRLTRMLGNKAPKYPARYLGAMGRICEHYDLYDASKYFINKAQINKVAKKNSENGIIDEKELHELTKKINQALERRLENRFYVIRFLLDSHLYKIKKLFEVFREIALFCEDYDQILAAYFFMSLAKNYSQGDSFILYKCKWYRYTLESSCK